MLQKQWLEGELWPSCWQMTTVAAGGGVVVLVVVVVSLVLPCCLSLANEFGSWNISSFFDTSRSNYCKTL